MSPPSVSVYEGLQNQWMISPTSTIALAPGPMGFIAAMRGRTLNPQQRRHAHNVPAQPHPTFTNLLIELNDSMSLPYSPVYTSSFMIDASSQTPGDATATCNTSTQATIPRTDSNALSSELELAGYDAAPYMKEVYTKPTFLPTDLTMQGMLPRSTPHAQTLT